MKIQKIMFINLFVFLHVFVNAEIVKVFDFDKLPQKSTEDWMYKVKTVTELPNELLGSYQVPDSKWIVDEDGRSHRVTEIITKYYTPFKYTKNSNLTGVVYIGEEYFWLYEGVTLKRISRNYATTIDEHNPAIAYATITYTVETWTTANPVIKQYVQTGLTIASTVGSTVGLAVLILYTGALGYYLFS